jgi:hypothetical protein
VAALGVTVLVELTDTLVPVIQVPPVYGNSDTPTTVVHFESEYLVVVTVVEVAV